MNQRQLAGGRRAVALERRAASPVESRRAPRPVPLTERSGGDPWWMKLIAVSFYAVCALVVWLGWSVRDHRYISAKFGVGYALGIIGTTLMVLLLLYPARKRVRAMHNWGPVGYWFRAHMVLGVIGPLLILFHSNFSLGSFNSETVLICTLIVSFSGFFGRYFYARIHHGLYGHKATLEELQRTFVEVRDKESVFSQLLPTVIDELARVEGPLLSSTGALKAGIGAAMFTGISTRWAYLRIRLKLRHALDEAARTSPTVARERRRLEVNVRRYAARRLEKLRKYAQFLLFERLFSIWHVVHYPLFVVLVVAVIVHIVAVHMY